MTKRRLAVVFGGAGFIGRHLVPRLARQDYEVRVITRNPEAVRPMMTQGRLAQVVPWATDLRSDAALARAVEGATLVVNLIGILAEKRRGDFQRLQGELPGRIGRAAAAAGWSMWCMFPPSAPTRTAKAPMPAARRRARRRCARPSPAP
ncbi:SDR family NAD(P)-dependent oxidoreductase [Teichococcus aestuarii]|uniref:SDR family NAD(P)-dependent oxidoreductase n=1 Tax=Teichococcus aestuarii TaxID=568898 RepID=UPI00360E6A4F